MIKTDIQSTDERRVQEEETLANTAINSVHTFFFDILAFFFNSQTNLIVEYCQETQNWTPIQRFINDENTHILPIFFCDLQERNRLSKGSTIVLSNFNRATKIEEACIEIGIDKPFEDGGVIFLKPNAVKLTEKNYKNVELIIFSMNFDLPNFDLMINLEVHLSSYLPSIKRADEWNRLNLVNENTHRIKFDLICQIEQNIDFLRTVHTSLIDRIQLSNVPMRLRHDTQEIIHPNSLLRFAQDTELVQKAEETMLDWIREIRQFYRKSVSVRQVDSTTGPLNELAYWRKQMLQLHSLISQLRLPPNRAVIYLLNIAASPRSIEWREIDKKLTESINEARDHYKYLMILAKYIGPLYSTEPYEIQQSLPSLLNTIVLINSCSEIYAKSDKLAALLVTITNQIVISSKNYLTNNHTIDLRLLNTKELLQRIENVHNLYITYREVFLKTKQKIENQYADQSSNHLSERHVLGKLAFLDQRLSKLREVIASFDIYSLLSQSRIDGLEQITHIYKKAQTEFFALKLDFFNPDDRQFDTFYNQLNQILSDIDQKLYQTFHKDLHRILHSPSHNSSNALKFLMRYENLHIPFFDSSEFLLDILHWYEKEELQKVKNIYNKCRSTPTIERHHSPIIGRILWARRMYKRIQNPYVEFLKRSELKEHSLMKNLMTDFMTIANGFSIYELLYHRHWYNSLPDIVNVMCNPVLVRQNPLRQLYINYDPLIDVILHDCELLVRSSITVPDLGYNLLLEKDRIRLSYERLKELLKNLSILLAKAHPASYELVEKVMTQVDNTLSIGLNRLNWLSKNLDELFLPAEENVASMSDFLGQISSLIIHRIEEPIHEVSRFEILEFPDDSIDFKQFVQEIRQQIIFKAEKLNSLSMQIESAVLQVVRMFFDKAGYKSKPFEQKLDDMDIMQLSTMQKLAIQMFVQDFSKLERKARNPTHFMLQSSNEWERFNELCNEFLSSFETRFIEALTLCAKNAFEMIKNRANPTIVQMKPRLKKLRLYPLDTIDANVTRADHVHRPLIQTYVELQSSTITLNPSIDETQQLMNQLIHYVLNIFHGVRKWGEVRSIDYTLIHNFSMNNLSELSSGHDNLEIEKMFENGNEGEEWNKKPQAKTYYNLIANNKELLKLYQIIGNFFLENGIRFNKELEEYYVFRDLWEMNKVHQAKKFIVSDPSYASIRALFADFDNIRNAIERIAESKDVETFRYVTTKLKQMLFDEVRQLELIFAKYIRMHYRMKFLSINDFLKKNEPRLNRQLRDLDDVRFVINTLDTLKDNFVLIDHTIYPLEEVYNLFKRYAIDIPLEEQTAIEMLRSTHERLLKRAKHVTHELVYSQQRFLDRLLLDKSITASQMFGILDVATNDWTDGIFSTLWRRTLKAYEVSSNTGIQEAWWIILDGPVDAIWIENLNSVLDDNKLLTLANGDRILMAANVKLVFEVHNIDNASPATVSRCGMIFMSSTVLPWRPIFQAWSNKQSKNIGSVIFQVVEKHFDEIFKLLITKCSPKMKVYECNYIKQITDLLDGLLNKELDYSRIYLERLTIFAIMWSMGALLELNDRSKLEQYFINSDDSDISKNVLQGDSIFDYLVNDSGQWEHWSTRVESWEYPKDETIDFASILVPNIDNVRITYLINILSKQEKAVLLIGEPGTAKTVIITSYLKNFDSEQHLTRIMNFSSITTSAFIQKTIENFVDKRVANTFGPSFGRKMTIFIDDINMPMINSWGDQEANEILRQLIEQKGFYSLSKPGDFLNIIDLQFLAAMGHPGGGRNDIPERLKRHFFILNCTLPSNTSVDHIFGSIAKYFCPERNFSSDLVQTIQKSVSTTRILWQTVKGKFLPTPAKFHYIFNLRDLSRIWEGILQIESEQCQNGLEDYFQLWKHECTRVLGDRLILPMETEWFRKELYRVAKQAFGDVYKLPVEEESEVYFANFLRDELEVTDEMGDDIDLADLVPKIYEPIVLWEALQTKLINSMNKMNGEIRGSNMDLVFFKDAMIHLLRISRVINMPKGHLLLVGVGGSGKQSLTKLAAYIAGYKYFQISVSRTYTLNNFLDDLRNIYRRAGRLGQGIVFIFTDNDIKDDQFLEYLNNVLSSGEVSGLITREEMDETLSELSVKMKKEYPKRALTNENLLNYYRERLRKNLHVILCFSPDNRKFRERALKFPALVSGCTIDWFHRWPLDALVAVSDVYLNRFDILVASDTVKKSVIELMANIHDDVSRMCESYYEKFRRRTYVTPKSFLSYINAFKQYYQKQRDYFEKEKQKMKTGVQKLFEAAEQVQEITQELVAKEKHMVIANAEAAKQVAEMEVLRSAAEIKAKEVQESKETAEILVKQVNEEKAIAEDELSAAEVILKEAEEAVKVSECLFGK
ncbi:unnamed protein product [Adineta ricciae]|uniref:Uncharacterized protein n=1 Tax=Adineta ricciae TaxID=249248 RepID=A0A813XZT8_ADIRI|nr:unnamed protein product [Adineta ricciae]